MNYVYVVFKFEEPNRLSGEKFYFSSMLADIFFLEPFPENQEISINATSKEEMGEYICSLLLFGVEGLGRKGSKIKDIHIL